MIETDVAHAMAFRVYGEPVAQPRPRATVRGRHAAMYDPGTAKAWKGLVKQAARKTWSGYVFNGPVFVEIHWFMPRPKSHRNSKGELKSKSPRLHEIKPDTDNLEKAVLDALTDLGVWRDDSQVCSVRKMKVYGQFPGALVIITDQVLIPDSVLEEADKPNPEISNARD